jgi:hypothetical protein
MFVRKQEQAAIGRRLVGQSNQTRVLRLSNSITVWLALIGYLVLLKVLFPCCSG